MALRSILIVEDDRDIRENLGRLLECEGFSVLLASHGQEALNTLRSGLAVRPALIFLDLQMPVMDGSTFLRELESDASIKDLPVVVLTAGAERPPYQIAGFMKKPLDIDELIRVATQYAG